ncbi:MAG: SDR family oxidoreductase [Candidatus Sumerlaeaceae bacterium]|nr:SDR family oxidoreductase [Candidatus Sumerlaeaceae bacterium]
MPESNVIVITGTRKGIGQYLAQYYVEKGHCVVGCSREPAGYDLEGYSHYTLDVSNERDVVKMFSDVRKRFGAIYGLVNNAGIASMNHSLLTPLKTVQRIFDTNVMGTFLFCREAAKLMRPAKCGRIINFATVATPFKLEGEAAYASSKAAVVSLTEILAREYAEYGITVNAVGPTPVQTDLIRSVPKDKMSRLIDRQAIKRFGEFRDVSNAVDFFLNPQSDFVTGQVIYLGGA